MDCEKLESNRIKDVGGSGHVSSRMKLAGLLLSLTVLGLFSVAMLLSHASRSFDLFDLVAVASGTRQASTLTWEWYGGLLIGGLLIALLVAALAGRARSKRLKRTTRVDSYARWMGYGSAVAKVTRSRAEDMASRLVKGYDPQTMEPGFPLGRNIKDGSLISTSWEDMSIVLAGPRSGKSLCYAIPGVISAPGACVATSNKGDILDITAPLRRTYHPRGRIWVFDPERIADPARQGAPWVWDIIASIHTIADAKRIADCWRYASGQPAGTGDDYFPGTAARQLADYLFAASLGHRTAGDVFVWAADEQNDEPARILDSFPRYREIAARVSSVLGLTPETRSGVFGSLQTMVAFLADPDILSWINPDPGDGTKLGRPMFDPYEFCMSEDTLYLLSAQGRPSTALTAALTAVTCFTAFSRAQSECADNNRRLPRPLCCVLDEAANICRWPELADVYSYFGSAGVPIMTIWQNPDQGNAAFGETNFGSLFNNANTTVYLGGIKDTKFLGDLSSLVGSRDVLRNNVSMDERGRRNISRSVQKETILEVSQLAEWPVGRALVLASQSRAQIVKTLPWTGNQKWVHDLEKARKDHEERKG